MFFLSCISRCGQTNVRWVSSVLHVAEHNPQSEKTIVLIHGGGLSGWMWNPVIQGFSNNFHCLIPDLPGHVRNRQSLTIEYETDHSGLSREMKFSIKDSARHIAELINEKGHGGKATVVGLSLGAQVALELLTTEPGVVEQAVISSALVQPLSGYQWFYHPVVMTIVYWMFVALPRKVMNENGNYRLQTKNLTKLCGGNSTETPPVLVIVGSQELKAMKRSAQEIVHSIPNAIGYYFQSKELSGANEHIWPLNYPQSFIEVISTWLQGQPLPTFMKKM